MVFSSVPLYLDPPNWQQHPNQQQLQSSGNESHHLLPPQPMPQPPPHQVGITGPGGPPIRPNSMAERARLAKIPPPEAPLKCPRCESSNTKFCYFNNYSLSQPRHFCKTCRRYWTRGGALRNVPVGGGCRRNKRSSTKSSSGGGANSGGPSSSSKSSLSSPTAAVGDGHVDIVGGAAGLGGGATIPGLHTGGGIGGGMTSFMASLQNIAQLGMGNLGLTFGGGLHAPPSLGGAIGGLTNGIDFNAVGNSNNNNNNSMLQFPHLGGFEMPGGGSALYSAPFQTDHHHHQSGVDDDDQVNLDVNVNMPKASSTMMASVKMEEGQNGLNLGKQLMMGMSWPGSGIHIPNTTGTTNMWTDLSGLNSSSSGHLL